MLDVETAIAPRAWRIEFAEGSKSPLDGVESIEIAEPRNVTALLIPLEPAQALAPVGLQADGAFVVVWMPPGVNAPPTIEHDVDDWLCGAGGTDKKEASARADVRTLRVAWSGRRVVVYANEGDIRFALDAVLRFIVVQKEALALNAAMKSIWNTIEADSALNHVLTSEDRKKLPHLNDMTGVATRMRMTWLRVKSSLEQLNPAFADASKRLFAELVAASALYDLVDAMEDEIQFALAHYEGANTRLIEMTLVRQERIESIVGYGVIIVLLVVQIGLMLQGM